MSKVIKLFSILFFSILLTNFNIVKNKPIILSSPLVANNKTIGTVTVSSEDRISLTVTFTVKKGYSLQKTNLYLGDFIDIPLTENGCPNLEKINKERKHNSKTKKFSYKIPVRELKKIECYSLIANAIVKKGNKTEQAWSKGEKFSCNSEASYSKLCKTNVRNKMMTPQQRSINNN